MKTILKVALASTAVLVAVGGSFLGYQQGLKAGIAQGTEKGRWLGVREGIKEGRRGWQQSYVNGPIPVEGYDRQGWDYDCQKQFFYLRPNSGWARKGIVKADVGYTYNDLAYHPFTSRQAKGMKEKAEAVCLAAGYRPEY